MNFSTRVRELVTADGTKMNLTAEQKEALLNVQNAGNAEIYEGTATSVRAVDIAKAVEAASTAQQQNNTDIFASKIDLATASEHKMIPCATSKATNIVTGDLKDAVVMKAIMTLNVNQVIGTAANAAVRNDTIMPFAAKSTKETEEIVKKSSIKDFTMSGTMFPEDIHDPDSLNGYINFQHLYKSALMAEFLVTVGKMNPSTEQLLTIYRCASRSTAEEIFDAIWKQYHPLYDNSDPGEVSSYVEARKAYMAMLENIGSKYMSSSSIKFGMSLRKLSISPTMKWTSESKVGHVKQFASNKSYYVGSNIDSGLHTVPMTTKMLATHIGEIIEIVTAGCALLEKEVRQENGLPYSDIVIPDYSNIKYDNTKLGQPYWKLLNIEKEVEKATYERLFKELKENATIVVQAVENKNNNNIVEELNKMMGD